MKVLTEHNQEELESEDITLAEVLIGTFLLPFFLVYVFYKLCFSLIASK